MTVLAAFRYGGIPILIGDMIITGATDRPYQRKVYWVSRNLVVGWTGHMVTAKIVVTELLDNFNNRLVTKLQLERLLKNHTSEESGSLDFKLMGWIMDEEASCFLWNSAYPEEVFYNDSYFDGSGGASFSRLIQGGDISGSGGNDDPQSQVLLHVLTNISQAVFEQILYPGEWDNTFGFGYDVLIHSDGQFKWVGSIMHLGWGYHWHPRMRHGRPLIAPPITKYVNQGDHSIILKGIINRAGIADTRW